MKKVLLIAGLAMCASLAFAQPAKVKIPEGKMLTRQAASTMPVREQARVDYKASIFTKDVPDTAFFKVDFSSASQANTSTLTSATATLNDTAIGGSIHANTTNASKWMRVPNRAALANLDTVDYPFLVINDSILGAFMGPEHGVTGDNGFMALDAADAAGTPSDLEAYINAYFQIPVANVPAGVMMVDLKFHQFSYRKRYQEFYVDYKSNNKWYSFEVNTSVDYDVNSNIADTCLITLPSEAMSSDRKITLRFRYFSFGRGQDHGYGWLIDDVEFWAAEGPRWAFSGIGYIDGFYGMIPEGFNLPLAFTVAVQNTGTVNLQDVQLVMNHRYWENNAWVENTDWELVADQNDIPAGTPRTKYQLNINERGFMNTTDGFGGSAGWYQASPQAINSAGTVVGGWDSIGFLNYLADPDSMDDMWTRRSLPTDHRGKNQFIIKVVADANGTPMTYVLDTMTYTVTGSIGGSSVDSLVGLTVPGYRWGNDNGVIPSGSEFGYCLLNTSTYAFDPDQGHQYQAGYDIETRFVTPDVLPDTNWVFRGIEIIPATGLKGVDIHGRHIAPSGSLWFQPSASSKFNLYGLNPDNYFGTSIFTVDSASVFKSGTGDYGYVLPSNRYNAVNILFPEQPSIYTNASYLFGYENKGGFFSVARTRGAFDVSADSSAYYTEEPALADYYNQFRPAGMCWTAYMYDPAVQDALVGYYFDYFPLIRMIVGPKMNLPKAAVTIDCNVDQNGANEATSYWVERGRTLCDTVDSVAKGITYMYEIYPGYEDEDNSKGIYSHSVITNLYIDGQEVDLSPAAIAANPNISSEEFDVVNVDHDGLTEDGDINSNEIVWPPLLKRNMYIVYFEDIQTNHTISARTAYRELSINEVAPEVKLRLAPNPATSQVHLNIAGVTGKVNCNVIDMSGRVIYNADINAEKENIINLNGVPAGAYFVRITNDNFSKVEKLVVR